MSKIELKNIRLSYYNVEALFLEQLSLNEPTALIGCSGSGKSNMIKVICGLEYIDSGEIFLSGVEVGAKSIKDRNLSLISPRCPLLMRKTVRDNLEFPLKKRKLKHQQVEGIVLNYAKDYGLTHCLDEKVSALNLTDKASLFAARAAVKGPSAILLDDIEQLRVDTDRLLKLVSRHFFVLATYDFDQAKASGARRFIILRQSFIIFDGNLSQLESTTDPYIRALCMLS